MKKFSIATIILSVLLAQSALACPLQAAAVGSLTDVSPKAALNGIQLPQPVSAQIKGVFANNGGVR